MTTSTVSKPVITKKKYSELPALHALGEHPPDGVLSSQIISDTHIACHSHTPESEISNTSSTPPQQLSLSGLCFESIALKSPSTQRPCRRRVRRIEATDNVCVPEPTVPSNSTPEIRKIAEARPKRGRKALLPTPDSSTPPRTQLATEILENLSKFSHCILLTRVGQFYESYFDQAAEVAGLLNIKLTSRKWDRQAVLMCGFPVIHLQKHLNTLVQQNGRFVALCEEFARSVPPGTRPSYDRRVVRIVTPGTLIDEPFLNHCENNYLMAISPAASPSFTEHNDMSLAWIDVSTGEFFTKSTTVENLYDDIVRLHPREVVLPRKMESVHPCPVREMLRGECTVVSYFDTATLAHLRSPPQPVPVPDVSVNASPPTASIFSSQENSAVSLLTVYLQSNLLEYMPSLSAPSKVTETRMEIDAHTLKSLEIREGVHEGGTIGTLLSCVKRTVSSSGTRLLSRLLCSPSTSLSEINTRQSIVAFFHARPHLRRDLRDRLRGIDDVARVVQKFLLRRGNTDDVAAISMAISIWSFVKSRLLLERKLHLKEGGLDSEPEWASIDALISRMEDLPELEKKIRASMDGTSTRPESSPGASESAIPPQELSAEDKWHQGYRWSINPEFSRELSALHAKLQRLLRRREDMESDLQRHYSAPSLTLRSSPLQGLHVYIAKSKRDAAKVKASPAFTIISESNSTCCFFHQGWAQLGSELLETSQSIASAERAAFEVLRSEVIIHEVQLRRNARVIDELDVALGFASLASDRHFTRPNMTDNCSFHVVNGRHPTVEVGLLSSGRVFTPNTVSLCPDSQLHIITGPNMAGKSTLLRQTALIAILAQSGSFVPADHAEVGIVDRLFSRVGAKDDVFRDRSTFMVEMLETADILRKATPNSLVIMDEVGRGTSVRDGLAIAFAVVHHLCFKNKCRALFATHFHELTDMLGCASDYRGTGAFRKVVFFCTDVQETEFGSFAYSHRLRPGVNKESHGLKVAQLAGMPPSAVAVAFEAISRLKKDVWIPSVSDHTLKALGKSLTPDECCPISRTLNIRTQ
ncbi:muts domain V-domain-containing protein [Russula compacta]|nr:muts domain V-domain-containing protein [Russula compacta]